MKKKTLLLVSTSFALGVVLIGAGVGASLHQKAPTNKIMEDVTLPDDNIGARVKLAAENDDPLEAAPTFVNTLGYRVIDEESGAKSVCVYAVTTGYKGLNGVSVTRSVKDSSGASVMAEKTIQFGYVYSSIRDADLVSWDEALPEESETVKNYYMVFTLKNIPESHWFDEIDVQFSLDNGAIINSNKAVANVKGLMPKDEGEGVSFALRENIASGVTEYFAYRKDAKITKAIIPSEYYTVEGHVASNYGHVTAIDKIPNTTNSGAFEGCGDLTQIVFPDTINYFGIYSFYGTSKLTNITLPKGLKDFASSAFSGAKVKEIDYDAIALDVSSVSAEISIDLDKIVISSEVESLPRWFLKSNASVGRIEYEGPIADFEALKTEENQNNGLFGDVFATDNQISVTFHLGDAKIGENTGDYVLNTILGKTVSSYKPSLKGKKFDGWYTDAELTTPFDASSTLSASIELYPKFVEFGAGVSAENPIVLADENTTFTETIQEGFESVYFKYTHPEDAVADWRYIRINEDSSVKDTDASTGSMYSEVKVYKDSVSDSNLLSVSSNLSVIRDNPVQKINGSSDENVRVWVEPGKTYYFRANPNSYYTDGRMWCGDLVIEWESREHDSISEAISFDYGETVTPTVTNEDFPEIYKFTATKTGDASLFAGYIDSYYYASLKIFDVTDETNIISVGEGKPSSKGLQSVAFLSLTEGHTYVIQPSYNSITSDTNGYSFKIDDPLPGTSLGTAIEYEIGTEIVTPTDSGSSSLYYKFTLDTASNVRFTLTGGTDSYAKKITLFDSDGKQISQKVEVGEESGSYWDSTTEYAVNPVVLDASLEAGTYYINAGYSTGNSTYGFKMTSKTLEAGDTIDNPALVELSDGSATLKSTSDGRFYSFTAAQDGFMQFNVSSSDATKVSLISASGTIYKTAGNGESFYQTVKTGDTILLKAYNANGEATVAVTYPSEIHDGASIDTAWNVEFGEDGSADITNKCTSKDVYGNFFKFAAPSTGLYRFYSTGSEGYSYDANLMAIYENDEDTVVSNSNCTNDNGKHPSYATNDRDFYVEVNLKAGETYYAKLKTPAKDTSKALKIHLELVQAGDSISMPIAKEWVDNKIDAEVTSGETYFSFNAAEAEAYTLAATSTTEDANVSLKLYQDEKEISLAKRVSFEAGKTYVLCVSSDKDATVSIVRTPFDAPLKGSNAVGDYVGVKFDSQQYYTFSAAVSTIGLKWDTSSNELDATDVTIENGVTKFKSIDSSGYTTYDYSITSNGSEMIAIKSSTYSSYAYLLSKDAENSVDKIASQFAKTANADAETGTMILSIKVSDGSRVYGLVKDGVAYLGITVEFASDEENDISSSASGFTVKDSSGNVIGTYTSSSKTLTEVTSPAA